MSNNDCKYLDDVGGVDLEDCCHEDWAWVRSLLCDLLLVNKLPPSDYRMLYFNLFSKKG